MSFTERLHPRAHDGKFAHGAGGGGEVEVRSRRRGSDEVVERRAPATGSPAPSGSGGAAWTSHGATHHSGQVGGSQYHLKRTGGAWSVFHGHPDEKRKVGTAGSVADAKAKAEDHARQIRTSSYVPAKPGSAAEQGDANARGLLKTRDPHGAIRGAGDADLATAQAGLRKLMKDPQSTDAERTKAKNLHAAVVDEQTSRDIANRPAGGTPAVGVKNVGVRAGDLQAGHMIVHPDGKIHTVVATTPQPGGKTKVFTKNNVFEIGSNEQVPTLPKGVATGKRDPSESVRSSSRDGGAVRDTNDYTDKVKPTGVYLSSMNQTKAAFHGTGAELVNAGNTEVGDKVTHRAFGIGTVTKVGRNGGPHMVKFATEGEKPVLGHDMVHGHHSTGGGAPNPIRVDASKGPVSRADFDAAMARAKAADGKPGGPVRDTNDYTGKVRPTGVYAQEMEETKAAFHGTGAELVNASNTSAGDRVTHRTKGTGTVKKIGRHGNPHTVAFDDGTTSPQFGHNMVKGEHRRRG